MKQALLVFTMKRTVVLLFIMIISAPVSHQHHIRSAGYDGYELIYRTDATTDLELTGCGGWGCGEAVGKRFTGTNNNNLNLHAWGQIQTQPQPHQVLGSATPDYTKLR